MSSAGLVEEHFLQSVVGGKPTDRTTRIDRNGHDTLRIEKETRRMEELPVTTVIGRAGLLGDYSGIEFRHHLHEGEPQTFGQRRRPVDPVDRGSHNVDAQLLEQGGVRLEVNQLLTTVRSPVAAVEQHDAPRTPNQVADHHVVAVGVSTIDGWELLTSLDHIDLDPRCGPGQKREPAQRMAAPDRSLPKHS